MAREYHLINLLTGESLGGFASLEGARLYAREEAFVEWDIWRGNVLVERHSPTWERISEGANVIEPEAERRSA